MLALSTLLSLVAAELLIRAFDPLGISYYTEISRHMAWTEPDSTKLWRYPANASGVFQGVEIRTNELGLRERPLDELLRPPPEPRVDPSLAALAALADSAATPSRRILWIGDSVVFGWGVDVESTFVRRLERFLPNTRCINAGVCGYDSQQELAMLEELLGTPSLERHPPDLVCLVYIGNDMNRSVPLERVVLLLRQSRLYQLVRYVARFSRGDPGQRRTLNTTAPGWQSSIQSVHAMAQHCHSHTIPFVVFLYGMDDSAVRRALWTDLSSLAPESNFTLVDVLPWFAQRDLRDLTNSIADGHANDRGHLILAAGMAERIRTIRLADTAPH